MTTATELARAALHRLAALGLPPTPENFQRFYAEAGSGREAVPVPVPVAPPPHTTSASEARELMAAVRRFAEQLAEATGSLALDIDQHNEQLRQSVSSLADAITEPQLGTLLSGVLEITSTMQSTVQASHVELLRTREEIEQLKVELQQSREWMLQDPLTGMQNRRGMDDMLGREVARARRSGAALSVAMLDLDKFKTVNDTYGHHAGDRVLVHMADITRSVLRESDVVVRYGGEEFLLILPDTDINGARFMLDRLQLVVQKTPLIHEGRRIAVAFSAGLAQLRPDDNSASLVIRADRAMLQAKAEGRNRVLVAEN